MRQEFKLASGPGPPRPPSVSSSDWEQHRTTIDNPSMARPVTLKQLMDIMRSDGSYAPS